MRILIVDDSALGRVLLRDILVRNGYTKNVLKASAREAIVYLQNQCHQATDSHSGSSGAVDLILMDGIMPEIEGIEACRMIRELPGLEDIPIIMVTGKTDIHTLQQAFDAGANDYIRKPFNQLELLARVRSALHLKMEMDKRKERERELQELNIVLRELSLVDGLTGVANRRRFDETLDMEVRRALRENHALSLVMMDIDFFKEYNDLYGHQQGDECLKQIASSLKETIKRPGDLVARYGGEEFAMILPLTDEQGAKTIAEKVRGRIEELCIPHAKSRVSSFVTLSLGLSTLTGETKFDLLKQADIALYHAKKCGRNGICCYHHIQS